MKKIIFLSIIFLIILTGCGIQGDIKEFESRGFEKDVNAGGTDVLAKYIGETGYVNIFESNDEFAGMYSQIEYENYIIILILENGETSCSAVIEENETPLKCNDTYAFMGEQNTELANEIDYIFNYYNIDETSLQNGDASIIHDMVDPKLEFSNLSITNSTYDNEYIEEDFVDSEQFISVSFDVKNIGYADGFELDTLYFGGEICYDTKDTTACDQLESLEDGDTDMLASEVLKLDSTKTVNLTAIAPANATDYYIYLESYDQYDNQIEYSSEKVQFTV